MKKVKFLGIEMNIIDEETVEDMRCRGESMDYMVLRVADSDLTAASPDLRRRRIIVYCDDCRHACFLDPKGFAEVARINPTILCSHCMLKKVKKAEEADQS